MGTGKVPDAVSTAIRRIAFWDLKAIARIEEASYNQPWNKDELEALLIQPEVEGWGLYSGGKVMGYAVVRYRTRHAFLETLTIHPKFRRLGMGSELMRFIFGRASQQGSRSMVLEVHETNLGAQLFFADLDFNVIKVLHSYFDDGADGYLFARRLYAAQTA